jgi:hypothetical protein
MKQINLKIQKAVLSILLMIFSSTFAQLSLVSNQNIDFSAAVTTVASGNWSNPAIWSNGTIPSATTDVIINNGHTVYIDMQGASSNQIVDLCRNLQIKQSAILRMGHNTPNFSKDLQINGSILCNGTFSSGRTIPTSTGDGQIYSYNTRIYLNLTHNTSYISGSGYFHPRILNISSVTGEKNLIIDLYNMKIDENFAIKSNDKVNVTVEKYAYIKINSVLGLTGSTFQFSAPTAKASLTIKGIVVTDDVSLFTRNTTAGETTSLIITDQGSLTTKKINNGQLGVISQAAGFNLTINSGGIFRLGQNVNFTNLTSGNPSFTLINNGNIRSHWSATLSSTAAITNSINQNDPNNGIDVSQIQHIFGASNIGGWYNFTSEPFMIETLNKYQQFGATSIKTTLSDVNGRMLSAYTFNSTWPNFANLTQVAQHPYMVSLFQRPEIRTHTFWITTKNQSDYKDGPDFNHDFYLQQEQQCYDLTTYLLETYGSMNKKFVYQNWEGDWMLRGEGVSWESNPALIPDNVDWTIEGMARMFRARQRGTERARNLYLNATAKVMHAIEFNKLWMVSNGNRITMMQNNTPSVVADVISLTRLDLASWSAYDGAWTDSNNPTGHAMWKGLQIARYYTNQTGYSNAACPVQIGEFAINENPPFSSGITESVIRERYGKYIGVALGLGIPNFYLWNFYNSGAQAGPNGFVWERGVQYSNAFLYQWLDGKWLVEPDGSWGYAATFLMEQWANALSNGNNLQVDNVILQPNPSNGYFTLKGIDQNSEILLADLKGRIVQKFEAKSELENYDVNHLQKGMYILLIKNQNQPIITKKLLIN